MNELWIGLACFVLGLGAGTFLVQYGYKLGFMASYKIRACLSGEEQPETLLKPARDTAEFDLLKDENKGDQ